MRDLGRLLDLVVRNSAPLPSVAEIFFLTVPTALTVTIPMGVLVGILIGLGRLAADSEVTAMRASGLGVWLFVKAIALFALAAWMLAGLNNTLIAPRSAAALADLQNNLKNAQASFEVQPRVFYENFKNYVLYIQDSTAGEGAATWKGIFLADVSTPSAPRLTFAQQGVLLADSPDQLRLHLTNGSQHESVPRQPQQYSISTFGETDIPIQAPTTETTSQKETVSTTEMTTPQLLRQARSADPLTSRWYWIEFHRRLALPTACIVLAVIGIPLGLSSRKGGKRPGLALTFALASPTSWPL